MSENRLKDFITSYFNINTNNNKSKSRSPMRAYTEHIIKAVDKSISYSSANLPFPVCIMILKGSSFGIIKSSWKFTRARRPQILISIK